MGRRAGTFELLVAINLPLGGMGDVTIEWNGQPNQVDRCGIPDDNVWSLVSCGHILREVVLAREVNCDVQLWWQVAMAEIINNCQYIVLSLGVAPEV